MSVRKFEINGILEAAGYFSQEPNAMADFETRVRNAEATKQSIEAKDVIVVSDNTLVEVFSTFVMPRCLDIMVTNVVATYQELGHKITEE